MDEIDYNEKMIFSQIIDQEYVEWAISPSISFYEQVLLPKLKDRLRFGSCILSPNICYQGQKIDLFYILKRLEYENCGFRLRDDGCYDVWAKYRW